MPGTNLTRQEAAQRAALISVRSYEIELDLTGATSPGGPGSPSGAGRGGETFGSISTIRFDCSSPGQGTFVDLVAPQVERIVLNGHPVDLSAFADSRIQLSDLSSQNVLVVQARCAYTNTGEGLHRFTDPLDGRTYVYSQFEVADSRRVFAVFEQPDLKATFRFTVTAPDGWTVVSNMPELSAAPGDNGTVHHFATSPRMSSYLAAVIGGPYVRWSEEVVSSDGRTIPMNLYARQSLSQHVEPDEVFDTTKRGFAFYESSFDYPFPFPKYDQLFVPEFNAGAMENIGAVTITEAYIFRSAVTEDRVERRAITILHELAHMWFGDLVTMRWWDDLWLNESFAEYASHLAAVANTRWQDAWTTFSAAEKTWAYRQDQLPSTHPVVADIQDLQDVEVNFDGITYAKGASVLRQLVAFVGSEAFLRGVAAYFKRFAFDNARLTDLLTELERASGRDLSEWAEAWLRTSGVNTLSSQMPKRTKSDRVSILQTGPGIHPYLRPQRIAVAGYGPPTPRKAGTKPDTVERVWRKEVDIAGPVTDVIVGDQGVGKAELILPNDGDLGYAKVRLDDESLTYAIGNLGLIRDPLARAVIWGSLWDSTRDAELTARDFVGVALQWLGHETSSTTLRMVLGGVATALTSYAAPRDRTVLSADAAKRLWRLLRNVEPGSDAQLHLLRAFARHARTAGQLDKLEAIRSGKLEVPGRPVDTDLSWELLGALVRTGRASEGQVGRALAGDGSAAGQVWAARLRAMVPTPAAKAAAWQRATGDLTLANEIQGATIAGFTDVLDPDLLVPFVKPYFEMLDQVWAERSHEMATNIVEGLYPIRLAGYKRPDIAAKTVSWLDGPRRSADHHGQADPLPQHAPALRRLVVEALAGLRRANAAQVLDKMTRRWGRLAT
ncbi:MAG: aminopeptidase N [Bifidobacteriaceae bacterium]|jgi:aminopeptidase N|nr:aminopeptidase N [Bifidobacteriaceae bacterium]